MTEDTRIQTLSPFLPIPLLLLAWFLFSVGAEVTFVDQIPVSLDAPKQINEWTYTPTLYCQNESCLKTVRYTASPPRSCSACGSALDEVPISEKLLLPHDTIIKHAEYTASGERRAQVTIVVAGQSRASMHKPEWCLAGQGFRIKARSTLAIKDTFPPLTVALLTLDAAGNAGKRNEAYFAYWFAGPTIATGSRNEMLLNMTKERVFDGKAYRWAYISVLINKHGSKAQTITDLTGLIRNFHTPPVRKDSAN